MSLERAASRVKVRKRSGMINEELSERFRVEGPGAERERYKERWVGETERYREGENEKARRMDIEKYRERP